MMHSRRSFLRHSLQGVALSSVLPVSAFAQNLTEDTVINAVKKVLAAKQGQQPTLKILLPEGSEANVLPIIQLFSTATGISIDIQKAPVDSINSKILIDHAANNAGFDIALPATSGLPDLIEAGALVDLTKHAKQYEPAAHSATALYSLGDTYKGKFYGYQTDGDVYLMFYRKDWLHDQDNQQRFADQHGYPLAIPQTWQQLDTLLQFFHNPEQQQYGGLLFRTPTYATWEWWSRFHTKGQYPVTADMTPNINSDSGIEALEELLAASQYLHPTATTNSLFDNWKAFANGETFCNIGWGGTQKYLQQQPAMQGTLAYSATPGMEVDGQHHPMPYFNWGWNYVVSSLSTEPELAYLFTLFATSNDCSIKAVRQADGFFDPFRTSHYSDPDIIALYTQDFLHVHQTAMQNSIPDFYVKGHGLYFTSLAENIGEAMQGSITATEALNMAAKEWQYINNRMGRKGQQEQWQYLQGQYPRQVQALLR